MADTVTIPKALAKRLEKLSGRIRSTPAALIKSAIEEKIAYEEWFLKAVEEGIKEADHGKLLTTEEVRAAIEKHRAERGGKTKKAA